MVTYQDLFWYVWNENQPKLATSIVRCAVGKYRYRGDPQDVVQEVMLSAYREWSSFDESRAAFSTWVLWLTKQYLANLYDKRRLQTVSLFLEAEDGTEPLTETIADEFIHPEDTIAENERQVQIWTTVQGLFLAHRDTRKGQILEAMAALIDSGTKPTLRNIAALVGCSHTWVAKELEGIRKWLKTSNGT